jgi:hypothetical protein
MSIPLPQYPFCKVCDSIVDPPKYFALLNEAISDPSLLAIDNAIAGRCSHYATALSSQHSAIQASESDSCSLLLYSQRMAVSSMRQNSHEAVRLGLIALSMEDQRFDPRETVTNMAMLRHAANTIGCDYLALSRTVAAISSSITSQLLLDFALLPQADVELYQYGLRETRDANGVTIVCDI